MTREKPLCPTRRETQAMMGASGFSRRPDICCRAALQFFLPAICRAEKNLVRPLSRQVIHLGVDAVEDAAQLVAVVGDNPLQAVGIEGVLELVGVGGGDGGHVVGGIDSPFHQIHVSVVGQHVLVEVPVVEPEHILQSLAAVSAWYSMLWMVNTLLVSQSWGMRWRSSSR